jgi:RNA polymerase sigma-70 factor (ECF subfamily)
MTEATTQDTEPLGSAAERLRPRLIASAHRVLKDPQEAEDVVQDVLLRATQADDVRSAPGWLFAVTYRLAVDRLRARQRRNQLHAAQGVSAAHSGDDEVERLEEARRVRAAVAGLDDPYGTAVRLRYLEGQSFAEIAEQMQTLERTARTWVGRGLSKLRQRLGGRS